MVSGMMMPSVSLYGAHSSIHVSKTSRHEFPEKVMRSGKPTPWAVADTSKLDGRGLVEPTGVDCGGDEAARSRQQSLEIGLSCSRTGLPTGT